LLQASPRGSGLPRSSVRSPSTAPRSSGTPWRGRSAAATGAHLVRDVLLDTGPIVATLDARDQWHARCVGLWDSVLDRCVTTEAVVTEACYLVGRGKADGALPLEFLLAAGIPIIGLEAALQPEAARLM